MRDLEQKVTSHGIDRNLDIREAGALPALRELPNEHLTIHPCRLTTSRLSARSQPTPTAGLDESQQ